MSRPFVKSSIYLSADLARALDAEAARLDRSRSWIVQQAVRRMLPVLAELPAAPVVKGGER